MRDDHFDARILAMRRQLRGSVMGSILGSVAFALLCGLGIAHYMHAHRYGFAVAFVVVAGAHAALVGNGVRLYLDLGKQIREQTGGS